MRRDDVVEALTVERYGSQWAAREQQRQEERRRLLAVMDEIQRENEEKSA